MKILVGVNKSEESQLALRHACHLLEHFDAEERGQPGGGGDFRGL
ncbi:MAG: universal stress protein [Deltaproteobacteria bacterium]|nr:universal stress protein [Deltaproteobacteria bacterium]